MTALDGGEVEVPGARIHWQRRGTGPALLILQGGDGDADASAPLSEHLRDFTVISHDRRGLSRSAVTLPGPVELSTHTQDLLEVLDAATPGPVLVFGTSIGALIGLDLLARHPQRVARLIAHEPPCTELLRDAARSEVDRARDEIDQIFQARGLLPAMRRFYAGTGINFLDREPDVSLPAANPGRLTNLKFFLEHDAPAARRFRVDVAALRKHRDRITVAAGERSRGLWLEGCCEALCAHLGCTLVRFPGDHAAYATRPRAFANALRMQLGELPAQDRL